MSAHVERCHPLSPLVKGWLILAAAVFFIGKELYREDGLDFSHLLGGEWAFWLLFLLGITVLALIFNTLSWWFTTFTISDDELVLEKKLIIKRSKRVQFSKIQTVDIVQPFIARLLGLAALKIDYGSSSTEIEFLKRDRAYQLRDFLINRAGGGNASLTETPAAQIGGVLTDLNERDQIIFKSKVSSIALAVLTSSEMVTTIAVNVVLLSVAAIMLIFNISNVLAGLFSIPALIGFFSMLFAEFEKAYNFTLTRQDDDTLRITSGLKDLKSNSVPIKRIGTIELSQPLIWKAFGWWRVNIEVLGWKIEGGLDNVSQQLMPIGTWADAQHILSIVWPDIDLDSIQLHKVDRRARYFNWFAAHTYHWGCNERVLIASGGLFNYRLSIVPHARVQSVGINQGPLQRLFGLATMSAHTLPGPIEVACKHLDATTARELAFSELERMRADRAREAKEEAELAAAKAELAAQAEAAALPDAEPVQVTDAQPAEGAL